MVALRISAQKYPVTITALRTQLRDGKQSLLDYINAVCDTIDLLEPHVRALMPEPARRRRLIEQSAQIERRYPNPADRPPLFGIPVGIKDMFRVNGFQTRAGSLLPEDLFDGAEAACIRLLKEAGALVLGKTVTTEFAYYEPGSTRNPHNLDYTPGGSSSGSAAAVTAGFCPLAIGTQTIGSVIRPAAYCGVCGFKASYERIPTDGLILFSRSSDHVGLFATNIDDIEIGASILCSGWHPPERSPQPVLGIPVGPYLDQAGQTTLKYFRIYLDRLQAAGYNIKPVPVLENIGHINRLHHKMIAAEFAHVHRKWFDQFSQLYRPRTVGLIKEGQNVPGHLLEEARVHCSQLRIGLIHRMSDTGIDLWVCPSATGPAPRGVTCTGDPIMNLPWTHAGLPAINLPAGKTRNGLPTGLQFVADYMADEQLLAWSQGLTTALNPNNSQIKND